MDLFLLCVMFFFAKIGSFLAKTAVLLNETFDSLTSDLERTDQYFQLYIMITDSYRNEKDGNIYYVIYTILCNNNLNL